jgi:peptide chain release factor 3
MSQALLAEVLRRKTFAIISHPDAGKTTLTEKLLLYGGAIHLAGAVKAKKGRAGTVSDWMEMERERGISITSSVLQFPYRGYSMNLLDTPGHADFSEDTYRTLHAADGAVMLLDAAKGVEAQTKKLFRVCHRRRMPIFTFVNKLDRPSRDPFDLIGEVENVLEIGSYPVTWPVFRGAEFRGVYHRVEKRVYLFQRGDGATGAAEAGFAVAGVDDPRLAEELGDEGHSQLREQLELLDAAGDGFDVERFRSGEVSPMFFGSAYNNFGVEPFLNAFIEMLPPPAPRVTSTGPIAADSDEFSAFVFKIQANMDKSHRDRMAFLRVCSGKFERGMKVLHVRADRQIRLANPTQFMAQERTIVEEGYAGDILGIYDPGVFEIGDTLTGGAKFTFHEIPQFAPEQFVRVALVDPMKRKQLKKGLEELAQEGSVQLFRPPASREGDLVIGAVGELQFEVTKYRLQHEYKVDVRLEALPFEYARWVEKKDPTTKDEIDLARFERERAGSGFTDVRDRPVVLFKGDWQLDIARREFPQYIFKETISGIAAARE